MVMMLVYGMASFVHCYYYSSYQSLIMNCPVERTTSWIHQEHNTSTCVFIANKFLVKQYNNSTYANSMFCPNVKNICYYGIII